MSSIIGVVILAAGASSRMGKPKLLLPWGTTSILGHLIRQWEAARAKQITVVCAPGNSTIAEELDRIGFPTANRVYNPNPERGMFSSIRCAAEWNGWQPEITHVGIVLGDQPHLRDETLRVLIEFVAAHPDTVCQPSREGRRRHPVLMPRGVFDRLRASSAGNLKEFLHNEIVSTCELEDPGIDLDIDRPEDYEKALQLSAGNER
ncbi:MAG TPA: nucleotidyltransferase family protein [Verrucomicrobiae bacterium]|nr:nucleotidyltransferase family protein [Verrucomicrobiae bacterium]